MACSVVWWIKKKMSWERGKPKRKVADLVINVLDLPPPETLELVDFLLLPEDLLVKVLLDLLVGKVDAELLKAVLLKDLETGDIEDTNEPARVATGNGNVDLGHDGVEERLVDVLGQGITGKVGILSGQRNGVGLVGSTSNHHTAEHLFLEDVDIHTATKAGSESVEGGKAVEEYPKSLAALFWASDVAGSMRAVSATVSWAMNLTLHR